MNNEDTTGNAAFNSSYIRTITWFGYYRALKVLWQHCALLY